MNWVERVLQIRRGRTAAGQRAPHKPLLLLYALAALQRDGEGAIVYSAAEQDLKRLLREFGTPGGGSGPSYPFHHLVSDGIWTVQTATGGPSPGRSPQALRESGATGWLSADLVTEIRHEPDLLARLVRALLDDNFEPSLHGDICDEIGLALEPVETPIKSTKIAKRRDPSFRRTVLRAYEYRCAFCGYDGWLDDGSAVGLDAAHVRWWAHGGPDDVINGLCLCSLHHKLFDKGVLGVTNTHKVAVSATFVGRADAAKTQVIGLADMNITPPQRGFRPVHSDHITWHTQQVFRAPARAG